MVFAAGADLIPRSAISERLGLGKAIKEDVLLFGQVVRKFQRITFDPNSSQSYLSSIDH